MEARKGEGCGPRRLWQDTRPLGETWRLVMRWPSSSLCACITGAWEPVTPPPQRLRSHDLTCPAQIPAAAWAPLPVGDSLTADQLSTAGCLIPSRDLRPESLLPLPHVKVFPPPRTFESPSRKRTSSQTSVTLRIVPPVLTVIQPSKIRDVREKSP